MALLTIPSAAQFVHLATTRDGSVVYFASSLRQKGTAQFPHSKLFRVTADGLELFHEEACVPLPGSLFGGLTMPCRLNRPEPSGDGRIVAATARGNAPRVGETEQARLYGATWPEAIPNGGAPRLSRDGRWLLMLSEVNSASFPRLIDLASGRESVLETGRLWNASRHALADGGTVVLAIETGFGLWRNGAMTRIANSRCVSQAWISPNAAQLYYEWTDTGRYRITVRDLPTGAERDLLTGPIAPVQTRRRSCDFPHYDLSISDDGRRALAVGASVALLNADGSREPWEPPVPFLTAGVLSGDGRRAFVATSGNALLRFDPATPEAAPVEWIPPSPVLIGSDDTPWGTSFCPGCYVRMSGTGLAPVAQGQRALLVEGRRAPILGGSQNVIGFRIPWETTLAEPVRVDVEGTSLFESGATLRLAATAPRTWLPVALRGDFTGAIWPQSPARPGDVVVLFLTGLGRVRPLIPIDQPAPLDSLIVAEQTPECLLQADAAAVAVPVEFAGMAPGQRFLYQVNVRIPATTPEGDYTLRCGGAEPVPMPVRSAVP